MTAAKLTNLFVISIDIMYMWPMSIRHVKHTSFVIRVITIILYLKQTMKCIVFYKQLVMDLFAYTFINRR